MVDQAVRSPCSYLAIAELGLYDDEIVDDSIEQANQKQNKYARVEELLRRPG